MTPISTLTSALTPLTTSPSTTSQEAARQRKEARAKDALAALQTMREQRSSASEERKAAARKKVEDLKARIRALQMTMGGNPEAVARVAAQLARELGAAVKAYGAAGGSTAGLGGASASEAGPAADQAPQGEATEGQAAGAGAAVTTSAADTEASEGDPSSGDAGDKGGANPKDPYRQVIERQQAQAAEQASRNADKEADGKFATDIKSLAAQLKAILHQAAEKAKREGDLTQSPDHKAAEKALDQVTQALGDLVSPMPGVGGGFSLQI